MREYRDRLAPVAGWGWLWVVFAGVGLQGLSGGDALRGGWLVGYLLLVAAWLACVVGWVLMGFAERRLRREGRGSSPVQARVATGRPYPWFRLAVAGLLVLFLPTLVQGAAAAGAAALGVGRVVPFTVTGEELGTRGGLVVRGTWSDGGSVHSAALMDASPRVGSTVAVRRPPVGGPQVYTGAALSWVGLVILGSVLAGAAWLFVTTWRATRLAAAPGRHR